MPEILKQCFYDGGRMDGKLCNYKSCRYQHFLQKHPKEIFRERMKSKKERKLERKAKKRERKKLKRKRQKKGRNWRK